jgi:hypothetical protein
MQFRMERYQGEKRLIAQRSAADANPTVRDSRLIFAQLSEGG